MQAQAGEKTIGFLGLDDFNRGILRRSRFDRELTFRELLSIDEMVEVEKGFSFHDLVETAEIRLAERGPVDAIVNHWDFPGSCLHPLVCERNGFVGPRTSGVARCEHKWWARLVMQEAVPELVPEFCVVDPMKPDPADDLTLAYPFWLKPVVAHSSFLGFKIEDEQQWRRSIEAMRKDIDWFGKPFEDYLSLIEPPRGVSGGGCLCIAEEIISAPSQFTLEGYVYDGRVVVYGVIDSIREHGSSFARYEYPSRLPNHVIERACRAAETLMPAFELGRCCFNVEFFWDDGADRLSLLEVNTRLSKSHCPLFLLADGNSHHAIAIELALGREPGRWPAGAGPHDLAAKSMVRLFQDGVVTGLPREREVARLRERFPDAMLNVLVDEGARLSNLKFQDSYSFELANLFMGGETEQALREQYAEALEILPFEFDLIAPEPH